VAAGALAGCSGPEPVRIDPPELPPAEQAACATFLEDLPVELAEEAAREVEPEYALGAAYGDPPIVITCVDRTPEGFDELAQCQQVNDVGWFVPDEQVADQDADAVLTALSHRPFVEVRVPAEYRPDGVAAVLSELSEPIADNLELVDECL
jgi:hypothetical protein